MALMGRAALAMWWDIAPEWRREFEHWHSHEHFPERLGIPGFLRASRFAAADGGEGFFILYEMVSADVLGSPGYLARLNAPTPWSTKLMPQHRNMVRMQCELAGTAGGITARHVLALRFAQDPGAALDEWFAPSQAAVGDAGLAGLHLLRHRPPEIAPTTEQRIRGLADAADAAAVLVAGYEREALEDFRQRMPAALGSTARSGVYSLSLSMARGDA